MLNILFEEYSACFPFEKISDLVYRTLLTCITSNVSLGESFTIAEVVDALQVSRTSVIRAIERLEAEGFVKQEKYHGVRICGREDICSEDMYLARATLEMRAAQLVADRITREEFKHLCSIYRKQQAYAADQQVQGLLDTDEAFHQYLIACTRDPFLQNAYHTMEAHIRRSRYSAPIYAIASRMILADHQLILTCIKDGNGSMAREAMRIHMQTCSENRIFAQEEVFGALRLESAFRMTKEAPHK